MKITQKLKINLNFTKKIATLTGEKSFTVYGLNITTSYIGH